MKTILFALLQLIAVGSYSQYIGVRARYTETRLVDDAPHPPKRENRLVLSFFQVSPEGNYTPVALTNYDIWVYKQGLQYGNVMGGVLDSTGNNYPGYSYPAPKAVAYFNTLGPNYIDCDPTVATHYVVNGHELDCEFITVSYWDIDHGTGEAIECFPAPNVCLPFYDYTHPYYWDPGNINFNWESAFPGPPYNNYNFSCGGPQQMVMRGVLAGDSSSTVILPVRFANINGAIDVSRTVTISWSNLTESDIDRYEVEHSTDGISFLPLGNMMPTANNGGRADYTYFTIQSTTHAYYRIKAIENNGSSFYSRVLRLSQMSSQPDSQQTFTAYPNPVRGEHIHCRLSPAAPGRYISSLLTPAGELIRHKLIDHNGGDLIREVSLAGLPSGIYQVVLRSATQKFTQKIVYVHH